MKPWRDAAMLAIARGGAICRAGPRPEHDTLHASAGTRSAAGTRAA
jgi:hypothetical protein